MKNLENSIETLTSTFKETLHYNLQHNEKNYKELPRLITLLKKSLYEI
jgi:hypothetical protein